jgi:hypothetical protein
MANFKAVNLSINLSAKGGSRGPKILECNPGGSSICWHPTRGCGGIQMTCAGTSSKLTTIAAVEGVEFNKLRTALRGIARKALMKKPKGATRRKKKSAV